MFLATKIFLLVGLNHNNILILDGAKNIAHRLL